LRCVDHMSLKPNALKVLSTSGVHFKMRSESTSDWDEVVNKLAFKPVRYLHTSIDYQLAYQRSFDGEWVDLSVTLYSDSKPVAIWPLSICSKEGSNYLSSQGQEILPPLFVDGCPLKTEKKITKQCVELTCQYEQSFNIAALEVNSILNKNASFLAWHSGWLEKGYSCSVKNFLYVDLKLDLPQIKYFFRKSYKSLISEAEREWNISVICESIELNIWQEFRDLHIEVAGRSTRSIESWDVQFESIKENQGFLITLRDKEKALVGGGFFQASEDEGLYAVGVYKRDLFDKPLGHVVQFKAIEEFKRRGCKWYEIGQRFYESDVPFPSDKELSISHFKEGFATDVKPFFVLKKKHSGGKGG